MNTYRAIVPALFLLALGLAACAPLAARPESGIAVGEPAAPFVFDERSRLEEAPMAEGGFDSDVAAEFQLAEVRLVIRNASLSVVVKDPAKSIDEISQMAQAMGGFVVASNLYQTTYGSSPVGEALVANTGSITIRVPADRLDEALAQIKDRAIEVRNQNVSGQDVTEEFTDLQSRLRNLEAAEEQLLEIMDSATKTEDVLRVFEELRRVREEIEIVRGRIEFLQDSARLSAISVDLIPDVAAQPIQIGRWTPQGTAKEALEALVRSLQVLADAGIWALIYLVPLLVLAAIVVGLPIRLVLRRLRGRPSQKESTSG